MPRVEALPRVAVVALASVIARFGLPNRRNDAMATMLDATPGAFGNEVRAAIGWQVGTHA